MSEKSFHITTFGCQMNANDSEWLAKTLIAHGFKSVAFSDARIHILNTCSVRDKPEQKVYSELGRIRIQAKKHPERDIFACVGGCVAQQVGEKLFERSKELRLIFGTDTISCTPEVIARLAEGENARLSLLDFSEHYTERATLPSTNEISPAAFVNIMQGCDNFCTYCIVPYVRGRQKSRKCQAIIAECQQLIQNGTKEITLLGQNVNSFGQDKEGDGTSFTNLVYKLANLSGLKRLRFMTPHPKDIAPELIKAFAELPVLSPRVHLPLQSGSDRILHLMNRKYDLARYLHIVEELKKIRPDILFSTDLIVGFPGETEEDFQKTMQALQTVNFAFSYSFIYSDRPGAKASLQPDKVEKKVALERLSRLQAQQNEQTTAILAAQIGKDSEILIEGLSLKTEILELNKPGQVSLYGRDQYGISVNITAPQEQAPTRGDLIQANITGAGRHTLKGRLLV